MPTALVCGTPITQFWSLPLPAHRALTAMIKEPTPGLSREQLSGSVDYPPELRVDAHQAKEALPVGERNCPRRIKSPIRGDFTGFGVQAPPRIPEQGKFPANQTLLEHATRLAAPLRPLPPGQAAMTGPLIAPLIPPRDRPGAREHGRAAPARRLPMAAASEVPAVPGDVVYGTGRIDESGRVADRAMTATLGWRAGDRLTFTAAAGVVIARRDPAGMVTMPAKPYLVIPAALQRRCGLRPGDHVLLAASPGQDKLAAYSFAVVDQALRAHVPLPGGEGRQP